MPGHDYRGRSWQRTRTAALARAGHRCQCCGERKRTLVVHHQDECGMHGAAAHDLSNLTVLCRACHGRAHDTLRRD